MIKICSKCHLEKDLDKDFYKHATNKDGHSGACKTCRVKSSAKWCRDNPSARVASLGLTLSLHVLPTSH